MLLSLRTIIFMRYPPYDKNTVFLPEFDDNMETLKLRSAKNFCTKPHQHVVDLPYNPLISINYQQYGIQSWGNFNLSQPFFFQWLSNESRFYSTSFAGCFFLVFNKPFPGPQGMRCVRSSSNGPLTKVCCVQLPRGLGWSGWLGQHEASPRGLYINSHKKKVGDQF